MSATKITKQECIDYIKLQLTGGVIELEIQDEVISKFIDNALVELRRYISQVNYVTVPYAKVIDLKDFPHIAVTHVYRAEGLLGNSINSDGLDTSNVDPLYAQYWTVFSGGGMTYNLQNYVMNYLSYNTLLQMRNTLSTDMAFLEDKEKDLLMINCQTDLPSKITIEYIPLIYNVEEIHSDYWIDILKRLSLAMVKIGLGRVRTRFTQSNALWTQDGETLLQEGNEELKELRETLRVNAMLTLPRD